MERSAFLTLLAGAAAATRALHIVALGDSLALATGASRSDGGFIFPAYRQLLATYPGSMLDNVAIGGSTAADVLRLQLPRIAPIAPDIAILCVGGNDVVRRTPREEFARTYHALVATLRTAAPRAKLICCGVPDVAVSPIFADERADVAALSAADNDVVRATAQRAGASYVDFYAITSGHGSDGRFFSRDRFHPSDAGYALLSAAFVPVLRTAAE